MCMSCGCKMPNDDHGDERHITMNDLQSAAEASNISVDQVLANIEETHGEYAQGGAATGTFGGRSETQ